MVKSAVNYLSGCCNFEVLYDTSIEYDEGVVFGICGSCHDYVVFLDVVAVHDCEMVSMCCGARPATELDTYLTGFCGECRDGTGFECEVDENCKTNTEAVLEQVRKERVLYAIH